MLQVSMIFGTTRLVISMKWMIFLSTWILVLGYSLGQEKLNLPFYNSDSTQSRIILLMKLVSRLTGLRFANICSQSLHKWCWHFIETQKRYIITLGRIIQICFWPKQFELHFFMKLKIFTKYKKGLTRCSWIDIRIKITNISNATSNLQHINF